jgi:tetratricopeptide (TPR) repeat protein
MGGVLRVVKRTLTEKQRQLHADFKMEPETAVQNIAQAVLDLTGGEPLFTRFMAEEILTGGLSAIENLKKNPPEDVGDYFRVQFEALDDSADSNTTWEILKFLVIARSGLTLDELAGLLEKPKRKVRVALENLGRFLLGEERVELMHARLHERVREEFTFHELETGQQRLLAWCRGYQERGWPANTPDYILDEYGGHLADTGDTQALYKLIGPEYMKRQFEASRSYTGFVRDAELALALASAGKDPDWVPLCRASLAIATLGSAATNAPPTAIGVLAQFGYMEEAIGYTELIQNPLNRAEAYGRIALACLKRNEREEAAEWVGAAVESLEDKELLGELEGAFLPMAAVFEALDDIEGVVFLINIAQRIGFSNWTARSMAEVVLALCRMDELGKIEDVLKENAPDADFLRKLLEQAADSNHDLEALYKIIIEVIQGKLASEAEDESLHGILSVVYSRLGKTAEAELSADQALALLTAEDKKINVRTAVWLATLFQANQLINQADQSYKLFDEIFDNFAPGGKPVF